MRVPAFLLGVAVAVLLLGFALSAPGSGMGGMMGGGMLLFMIPGLLFIILLVVALVLLLQRGAPAVQTPTNPVPAMIPREIPQPSLPQPAPPVNPVQERELVGSLPEDQRLLYVRIREAGGAVLQSDIVRWGLFSKPKVTRLLDRLEARGLAVRERHGMTNRVRLLPPTKPVS